MKRARNINLMIQIKKSQDWTIKGGKRTGIHKKSGWIERNTTIRKKKIGKEKMSKIPIPKSAIIGELTIK